MIVVSNNLSHYRKSRSEIARYACIDCGVNVIEIGDFCMINPSIWNGQLGLKETDNLCIACIEKRLGRKLRGLGDIISLPSVEGFLRSDILQSRLPPTSRKAPLKKAKKKSKVN